MCINENNSIDEKEMERKMGINGRDYIRSINQIKIDIIYLIEG
jgi:hypothetical protein